MIHCTPTDIFIFLFASVHMKVKTYSDLLLGDPGPSGKGSKTCLKIGLLIT